MVVVLPAATKSTGRYFQVMAQTVVDKIPPGPKLDALTAEKVFGWKNVHQHEAPAKPQTVFPLLTILWWWFFDWWLFGRWFFNLDSAVENITATDRRWSVATGAVSE
jgi:hypothetical protein